MKKLLIAMTGAFAILSQTGKMAAETPTGGRDGATVRVKAAALGTADWMSGKFIHSQGCTMVKLDRPSPNRYTSLMLIGISQLQVYKAGQWGDEAVSSMLKSEPASCRVAGSD